MNYQTIVVFYTFLLSSGYCQTCQPVPKKTPLDDLAATSPIVVEVSPMQSKELKHPKKGVTFNVTAQVVHVFPNKNGGLTKGAEIRFGPVGKIKNCANLKAGHTTYLLFLQEPDQDGFYWIKYNPVKASKRSVRKVEKKVLCKRCLTPVSFKKTTKSIKKSVGDKLKIKCKASGKPWATLAWYYNGVLLTKSTTPKEIKIKNKKKGRSFLEIAHLNAAHDGVQFICSAMNVASQHAANYTVTLKLSKLQIATCEKECDAKFVSFCEHGQCCREDDGSTRCLCDNGWDGNRCNERSRVRGVGKDKSPEDYNHQQQHLAVILGTCLTLMMISFICMGTYCLFKRKRSKMHRKLLVDGTLQTDASPIVKSYKISKDKVENRNSLSFFTADHANLDGDQERHSLEMPSFSDNTSASIHSRHVSRNSSDVSKAAFDRNHSRLVHKTSLSKKASMRGRLNGLAKSGSSRFSTQTTHNAPNDAPAMLPEQSVSLNYQSQKSTSDLKTPSNHNETRMIPSLSVNSGPFSIVKNQPGAPDWSHPQKVSHSPLSRSSTKSPHSCLLESPLNTPTSSDSSVMSTFYPSGDVGQKQLGQKKMSSIISQSVISSEKDMNTSEVATMPRSLPHGDTSQIKSNCRSVESDEEELFLSQKVSDTSLERCDFTPPHSFVKSNESYKNLSTDALHCPKSPFVVPHNNSSNMATQLFSFPLLSKQVESVSDSGLCVSTEPLKCEEASNNDSNCPEFFV